MKKVFFLRMILWFLELPQKIALRIKKTLIIHGFKKAGKNLLFDPLNSFFTSNGAIQIGNNVYIGKNAYFGGEICIGNNVMFGPNVTLLAGNHIFAVRGKSPRFITPYPGQNSEPIVIEDEEWIGANVTVLGNVTIGIGSVVGACSVVVNDVCPFTVSVGNPCHPVKRIFDDDTLLLHLKEIGYNEELSIDIIKRRNLILKNANIPVIDNTDIYTSEIHKWNHKI